MLIQGPPGTGKTTTITGIIAMVLSDKNIQKIHVCAPSNGAVDEIISKIIDKGLKGNKEDLSKILLRVGATSYESPEKQEHLELRYKV